MSNIKNKDTLYMVMREDLEDYDSQVVCCAITRTHEKALELCGQFQQEFIDRNIRFYDFFVQGQIFYDE